MKFSQTARFLSLRRRALFQGVSTSQKALLRKHLFNDASHIRYLSSSASVATPFDASRLEITRSTAPQEKPPKDSLIFGKTFTDHMLEIDWTAEKGWSAPVIKPFEVILSNKPKGDEGNVSVNSLSLPLSLSHSGARVCQWS